MNIPNEILMEIFSYLDIVSLVRVSEVSFFFRSKSIDLLLKKKEIYLKNKIKDKILKICPYQVKYVIPKSVVIICNRDSNIKIHQTLINVETEEANSYIITSSMVYYWSSYNYKGNCIKRRYKYVILKSDSKIFEELINNLFNRKYQLVI